MSKIVDNFFFAQDLYFRQNWMFQVLTVYKTKANKVQLVDLGKTDSSKPSRSLNWFEKSKLDNFLYLNSRQYVDWIISKFSDISKSLCFTKEQIEQLIVEDSLQFKEKELFIEMLYNWEKALAFDFLEIRKVKPDIALAQVIKTVKYKAQQVPGFSIPKALYSIVVGMLYKHLQNRVLKYYNSLYQNLQFLIKKKLEKYQLVNTAIEINKYTV